MPHKVKNFQFSIFNFQSLAGLLVCLCAYVSAACCLVPSAYASSCEPIYGGGPVCTENTLTLEKQVLNPHTNVFVHNLGLSDPKFHGNDSATFQITLTNTGTKPLQKIVVKDSFPSVITFGDGPGKFDPQTNTLIFSVDNLAPHHSQLFTITTKVVKQNKFSHSSGTFCVSNQVSALPSSGQIKEASSQFCIASITNTPATGPEALGLLALFPTVLVGWKLKKIAKNA